MEAGAEAKPGSIHRDDYGADASRSTEQARAFSSKERDDLYEIPGEGIGQGIYIFG